MKKIEKHVTEESKDSDEKEIYDSIKHWVESAEDTNRVD